MASRTDLRTGLGVLTGLWVTVGAAVPIGYVVLRTLQATSGGALEPELLESPVVVLILFAAYAVAAAIGGWAAGWVAIERRRRLTLFLSASHVGMWSFVLAVGAAPFSTKITLGLAAAAVVGSIVGVSLRARQVRRWSRTVMAG